MRPCSSVSNSHARQWISFQRPAEASLMTPSSRMSEQQHTPTPGRADTSACRNTFPTSVVRLGATQNQQPKYGGQSDRPASIPRSSAPAACTISKWLSVYLPMKRVTSSVQRGNHSPIPIGFSSFPAEKGERCGRAPTATIAKPSIRNTNRSPANSGIERASMLPAWH